MTPVALNSFSSIWADSLWRASWQGGAALVLVFVVCWTIRKIPADVRCWLWRLALLKLLVAGLWIVPLELPWLPPKEPTVVTVSPAPVATDTSMVAEKLSPSSSEQIALAAESPTRPSVFSWLFIAWIVGLTISLGNLFRQYVLVRKMRSRLAVVTDCRVLRSVEQICRRMSVAHRPAVCLSRDSVGPFLIGSLKPAIVLPSTLINPRNQAELNVTLAHEIAHIKRHDLLWNWLWALAGAVFFFHPLLWLSRREWSLTQEMATDKLALSITQMTPSRYARLLIALAATYPTADRRALAVAVTETYSHLRRRIEGMSVSERLGRHRATLGTLVVAIAVVGIVPWKLAAQPAAGAAIGRATESPFSSDKSERPTRTIAIRVVDPDGRPIKGANVFRNHVYTPDGEEKPKIENKDYSTNAKGEALVDLSGKSVDLRLWVSKQSFIPLHAMWAKQFQLDGDRIPAEFTFRMRPGTRIGGIVKNESGDPIKGVKVEVQDTMVDPISETRPVRDRYLAEDNEVVTDSHGRWTLDNVAPDKLLFVRRVHPVLGPLPTPNPIIALRLSHPDYASAGKWGELQREQGVTHASLRDQTATIVLRKADSSEAVRTKAKPGFGR